MTNENKLFLLKPSFHTCVQNFIKIHKNDFVIEFYG